MSDDYIAPKRASHLRLFTEPTGDGFQWAIDAAEPAIEGAGYTEACWTYDTLAEAVANIPAFLDQHVPHLLQGEGHHRLTSDQARAYDWADVARAIIAVGEPTPDDLIAKVDAATLSSASSPHVVALFVALLASSTDAELADAVRVIQEHDPMAWECMGYVMKATTKDYEHEDFAPGGVHDPVKPPLAPEPHPTEPGHVLCWAVFWPSGGHDWAIGRDWAATLVSTGDPNDRDGRPASVMVPVAVPASPYFDDYGTDQFDGCGVGDYIGSKVDDLLAGLRTSGVIPPEKVRTIVGEVTSDPDHGFRIIRDPDGSWLGSFQAAITHLFVGLLGVGPATVQVDFERDGATVRATGRLIEVETGAGSSALRFEDGFGIDLDAVVAVAL